MAYALFSIQQVTDKNTTEDNLKTENDVDDQLKDEIFFLQQLLNDQNNTDMISNHNVYLSERSTINQNLLTTTTTTSLQQQIQNYKINQQYQLQQQQQQLQARQQNQDDQNNNKNNNLNTQNSSNMNNYDFNYMQIQIKKLHKLYLNEQGK